MAIKIDAKDVTMTVCGVSDIGFRRQQRWESLLDQLRSQEGKALAKGNYLDERIRGIVSQWYKQTKMMGLLSFSHPPLCLDVLWEDDCGHRRATVCHRARNGLMGLDDWWEMTDPEKEEVVKP